MAVYTPGPWEGGSHWRRWNPHIHALGTLLNDQFAGDWEGYLRAIETAIPVVEVLGVTDYLSVGCYRAVMAHHRAGRLPNVTLLFPNVEMRLGIETERKRAVNLHLLFCPDDANHVAEIERVLGELTFKYKARTYRCTHTDLACLAWRTTPPFLTTMRPAERVPSSLR